ncbi:hypothetical protein NE683_19465 [Bariatricus massiliensis]|uniref:Peptidase C39-like domain-containing protein n=1 Tax=Bariatricus massiliensis TaxID=1745713 RepID=A0ABS8DLM7_9FIRM|nr:hypothetical protein [Bariatricus massiliensis]MCB7306212.1 hypothetical protein [Bariatricus massiliensis]MCB7376702.1 hypothetical protein [Bariatricus massiliensis]MCB7389361.1 hypothetical protein [Bariatricus massiliensis]MCB7413531.1 hypothetical protein [Bariatricus massiliensis]MCQ5255404.1 hypothetical protein [Bariatricus massiliensis]
MIKKIAVRAGVLTAVFIAAVILFSYLTNRGNTDMSADMGSATLPRISFTTEGYEVNSLPGYKEDMVISSMRDTVTPVSDYMLDMNVEKYDAKVDSVTWQVYTLNGEECLQEETVKDVKDTVSMQFSAEKTMTAERVLKVILHLEDQDVYYYTRIVDAAEANYRTCLDFAQNFLETEMVKDKADSLSDVIEPSSEGDNTTLQTVTIHSDVDHVTWGDLKPAISGDVRWEVLECNENYTSIQLNYSVKCAGVTEDPDALYTVKEFFRIRVVGDKTYLLDYNRTMNQVFDGGEKALSQKGVLLGIAPADLEYKNNSEGTIVSFIQNNELWNYNKDNDEMSLVFSFASSESRDVRNLYDQHDIRIVSVDKNGNTIFTVCGYMNRGAHEGRSGAAVYYFDAEKSSVEEKAFVPSAKGYSVIKEEFGKYVYYSSKSERLYVMMDGTLYCVDMKEDTREVLVRGLTSGQYTASEDGHLLAYQSGGDLNQSQKITVLNLQTGDSFDVAAEGEEYIRPIGFIKNDFVYGTLRGADAGHTTAGQSVYPMYKLDIVNQKQEIVKNYQVQELYILDTFITDNMMTINRVSKNEDVYTPAAADYITNNEEAAESNIKLETYSDEVRQKVVRLAYEDGIRDTEAKLLKPKQVLFDKPMMVHFDEAETTGKYYVFALGELQGVYDKAAYAVQNADDLNGVAVSSKQAYVWEKSNKPSIYEVDNMEPFTAAEGENTLAACLRQMLTKEGKEADVVNELANGMAPEEILSGHIGGEGLDLTGCTTEQILYTISRETPVIAMTGGDHAVLLIGYNKTNVAYLDPADGQRYSVPITDLESMVEQNGNTFIGYAI